MVGTCLIAEADPFIAQLLLRFVEQSGCRGVRAKVGEELVVLADRTRPNVIIAEAELPGKMRGWETVRALRADPATRNIAVISCSWLPETRARELMGDVSYHLQKPDLHYEDFLRALEGAGWQFNRHGQSPAADDQ